MPGSPPSNTTPPPTNPPPRTRSSSAMPVWRRGSSPASTSGKATTALVCVSPWYREAARSAIVSTNVFQALQCGHCPCHLSVCPPHSVQLNIVLAFATRLLHVHHWDARREPAEQLVGDRAGRSGDLLDRQVIAPQHDTGAQPRLWHVAYIDAQHVHRHTAQCTGAHALYQHGRARRCVARIPVGVAAGDYTHAQRLIRGEQPAVADSLSGGQVAHRDQT